MRHSKSLDVTANLLKSCNLEYCFKTMKLDGYNGIKDINFRNGMYLLCGLNGAGKSTIMSFIKDIVGIPLNKRDEFRIKDTIVKAEVGIYKDKKTSIKTFENVEGKRINDGIGENIGIYIDYRMAEDTLNFFNQENLEEYLEQFEELNLEEKERDDLTYLVGKNYDSINIISVEDENCYPFFKVSSNGVEYDSRTMGIGEHFIFFIYWKLKELSNIKIILIEEPETFISITSQENLISFLSNISSEKKINIIMTSHSPHIAYRLNKENICIISNFLKDTFVCYPETKDQALSDLGLRLNKKGTIYFEDDVGIAFFKKLLKNSVHNKILRDYYLENAKGEALVTQILCNELPKGLNYKVLGIYDKDMESKESIIKNKKIKNKFFFLPCKNGVEKEMKKLIKQDIPEVCNLARFNNVMEIENYLAKIEQLNFHDWFIKLKNELNISLEELVEIFMIIWKKSEENKKECDEFIIKISNELKMERL